MPYRYRLGTFVGRSFLRKTANIYHFMKGGLTYRLAVWLAHRLDAGGANRRHYGKVCRSV